MEELTPQMAAEEQLRRKLLPEDWKWVLVRGKDAFGQGTSKDPLTTENTLEKVKSRHHRQTGIGVVTGEASNGLVAIDIDGPHADSLLKERLGADWPDADNPGTMSWRGRPGRRQLLYQVPDSVRPLVSKFTKAEFIDELKGTDEEVCFRYDGCYSVIPGSKHPKTKKRYEWIDYNDGAVAIAPGWVVEFMLDKVKTNKPEEAHSFIPKSYLERQDASTDFTYRQMRRHFWMDGGLKEKLMATDDGFEKIFRTEVWDYQPLRVENEEKGTLVGGCPFHDSNSGKSFTLWENLSWYCHKEEVGGDALQLLHALKTGDINAGNPPPVVLQNYLQEIAEVVGENYPEDYREVQKIKEEKKYDPIDGPPLLEVIRHIDDTYENPAEAEIELMLLADNYGIRKSPSDLLFLLAKDEAFRSGGGLRTVKELCEEAEDPEFIIPELIQKPQTVVIHGESNAGKTATVISLAKHVIKGQPFKVRDEMMPVEQGPVIWFNGDCSASELKQAFADADLTDAENFYEVSDFKLSHKKRFQQYLNKVKPKLVVIDSLSSCLDDGIDENRRDAALPLYYLNNKNGTLWPSCSIIIIHHDNRDGQYRGHSAIKGAVSEMWQIKEIPEDKREQLPNWRNQRVITNRKTRSGLKDRTLLSTLNDDFTVSVEDWRPEEVLDENSRPSVMDSVLRVLRRSEEPLSRSQVAEALGRPKRDSAVCKSLTRLQAKGLICSEVIDPVGGSKVFAAITASRGRSIDIFSSIKKNPVIATGLGCGQGVDKVFDTNEENPVIATDLECGQGCGQGVDKDFDENQATGEENPVIATDLRCGQGVNRGVDTSHVEERCPHPLEQSISKKTETDATTHRGVDNPCPEKSCPQGKSQSGTQNRGVWTNPAGYRESPDDAAPVRRPMSPEELFGVKPSRASAQEGEERHEETTPDTDHDSPPASDLPDWARDC